MSTLDFIDNPSALPCPVNARMRFEDVLANNLDAHADMILQCSVHDSPMPNHQPGLLIKEVPVAPGWSRGDFPTISSPGPNK